MDRKEMLMMFWTDVTAQNDTKLKTYFTPDAYIRWNNTNKQFSVEEYIVANCEYPGEWCGDDGVAPQWRLEKHIGRPIT